MYALYIEVSIARMQQMQLVSQKNIEMTLQTAEKLCSDLSSLKSLKNLFVYSIAIDDRCSARISK